MDRQEDDLSRRGMKPEVKDVVYVVGPDEDDDDVDDGDDGGGEHDSSTLSMVTINNVPAVVFENTQVKVRILQSCFAFFSHCGFYFVTTAGTCPQRLAPMHVCCEIIRDGLERQQNSSHYMIADRKFDESSDTIVAESNLACLLCGKYSVAEKGGT